jgi:hypothetical protein
MKKRLRMAPSCRSAGAVLAKTNRLSPMDERAEGIDLGASPNSDKPEKALRSNSA